MSTSLCYMSGYGVEIDDLLPLLNEKATEKWEEDEYIVTLFEDLTLEDKYISWFTSDDGQFLYIRDTAPYAPIFNSIEEIDEHFYKALKPYLKKDVTKEDLSEVLDDVFSYDFC